MNYPVVNLIRKGEMRYQGAVSRRFLFASMVATPILCIAVFSGIKLVQYGSIRSQLVACRKIWADLQPRQDLFFREKKGLDTNRQALALVDAWKTSRMDLPALLEDIRQLVPPSIQLTHMQVRNVNETSVFKDAKDLHMDCKLSLQGLSYGEFAEDAVIAMRKEMLASTSFARTFDSMELGSMRKQADKNGQGIREFSFEAFKESGAVK